ncbi:Root phototropism protein 3 [Quillaja saponaria]|uniref:Root phototropism protein 3 n=1 Tax=Quillaja saponaria TaxID=32244 RepID=A0AAD7KVP3_QUISA|nr:Root phototropism protein 3 [Quillaja saponaria]
MIIESLVSIIPPQKDSVSCSFLLLLLRMANMLQAAPALVTELEKRVGMQLEQAMLEDLLIHSYNKFETTYDVDLVQRLLEHFLLQEQTESSSPSRPSFSDNTCIKELKGVLAEALPESARTCDDGHYRAIDSYLTAHPTLTEHERKRLCGVMDC